MINNIPREGELIEEYLKYHDNFQMQNGSTTSQISNLSKSHISTLHSFSGSISPCNKKEIIASIPVIRRRYDSEDSGDSESELENYSKRSSPNFNSKSCNSEELLSLPEAFPQIKTDSPPAHNNTKNSSQTDKSGFLASDKVVEAELDTSNPTSVDSVVKQKNPTLAEAMAHRQKLLQQQHYPQNQPRGSQPFICPPPPIKASARLHLPEQLIFKFLGEDVVVKKPPFNRIGGTYVIQFKVNKSKYFMGRLCPDTVVVGDFVIVGLHGLRGIDCGVVAEVNCPPVKQQCKAE